MKTKVFWMITMIIALTSLQSQAAEIQASTKTGNNDWQWVGFIEMGTIWEIDVYSTSEPTANPTKVTQWMEETEVINDKTFMKLWSQEEGAEKELISYIRIDNLKIYALDPGDIESGEKLIYDFTLYGTDGIMGPLSPIQWNGSISKEQVFGKVQKEKHFTYGDNPYTLVEVTLYDSNDIDNANLLGTVNWINRLGSTAGLLNQCYSLYDGSNSVLRKVTAHGSVVYYNPPASVEDRFEEAVEGDGIKYGLDGRIFGKSDKGIYILNGKKYIQR